MNRRGLTRFTTTVAQKTSSRTCYVSGYSYNIYTENGMLAVAQEITVYVRSAF